MMQKRDNVHVFAIFFCRKLSKNILVQFHQSVYIILQIYVEERFGYPTRVFLPPARGLFFGDSFGVFCVQNNVIGDGADTHSSIS
jgi:hypothetical protein